MEKNPLLARDEGSAGVGDDASVADRAETERLSGEDHISERSLDRLAEAPGADGGMDVRHDDLYADASPGDRATGDAGDAAQASQAGDGGGAIDWSRASKTGGSFDTDGEGLEGILTREKTLAEHLEDQLALSGLTATE